MRFSRLRTTAVATASTLALGGGLVLAALPAAAGVTGPRATLCPSGPCQAGYEVVNSGANFKTISATTYLRVATDDNLVDIGAHLQRYFGGPSAAIAFRANSGLTDYDVYWTPLGGSPTFMSHGAFVVHQGDTVTYTVHYNSSAGKLSFTFRDDTQGIQTDRSQSVPSGLVFRMAGVGAQDDNLGFANTGHRLVAFSNVSLTTANGKVNGLNSWFTTQPVQGTSDGTNTGAPRLTPSALTPAGKGFNITVTGLQYAH